MAALKMLFNDPHWWQSGWKTLFMRDVEMDVSIQWTLLPFVLNTPKKNIKHTITCDTFWFLKISSINEGSHWFVRNRVVVVFILESRIHYFEYAQSGKVPMDVAVLSILGWILAAICFESENVTAYILCFECIGKNCCPSLCYFPNPDTALLVFPLL